MYTNANYLTLTVIVWGHYYGLVMGRPGYHDESKLPVILMQKQEIGQDGILNYAFAADNGMQQGETISPDGSRTGAYSYVDPNGEKISVKYTAGIDGFQILQGDHIPKTSVYMRHDDAPLQTTRPRYNSGGIIGKPKWNNNYYKVHESNSAEEYGKLDDYNHHFNEDDDAFPFDFPN